jgi:oleate hydratase
MFAIEHWNDLVEMKRYLRRFMHDFHRMVQGTGEVVTPYHNYDSMVLPTLKFLRKHGVDFKMGCKVTDLDFKPSKTEITVERIHFVQDGENKSVNVNTTDYVMVTNGSMTADSRRGTMDEPAQTETRQLDGSWSLWKNIAKKKPGLGNPSNFADHIDQSKWITFNVTTKDPTFMNLYEKFTGNKPGQADMVTFRDSNWHMSILVPHQPHFINQPKNVYVWGGCGLDPDKEGNYVKKKMSDCNGKEILTELCYQFGFIKELPQIIKTSYCFPNMMPYEMSHFLPRKKSDRPLVVPEGSINLACIGQFVESGECVMLVESSVRSAQMAVYTLLKLDKKVPPVYSGVNSPVAWYRTIVTAFK